MLVSNEVVMFKLPRFFLPHRSQITYVFTALVVLAALTAVPACLNAQSSGQKTGTDQQKQPQAGPDSGGPGADSGAIAIPKKNPDEVAPPPPPAPSERTFKNPEGAPNYTLKVEVPEVTVDVGVLLEKTHQFVPGLKPSNFRVYEDGVEQKVEGFKRVEAPITALLLCEFAARGWIFREDMLNATWAFTQQLRPQDYIAMMTFDLNTHIVSDFTQDKNQIQAGLSQLAMQEYMPAAFSETDIFDALSEALDRMSRIEGEKYIVLIASGVDTLSKLTLDKILKKVKDSREITIFSIATGGLAEAMSGGGGGMGGAMAELTYLQAQNQLKTFANLTGGMYFEPRFTGELPDMVRSINDTIRSKYELVYRPTNAKQDGSYRKLRVVLVDDEGQPLRIQDQKKKPLKYDIIARDGYRARQEVE
jgi:VWFA-related protein